MKQCPKCKSNHNKPGVYCSRSCANSRQWSDEDKVKKSISAKKSEKVKQANKNSKFPYYMGHKSYEEYIENTPFNMLGLDSKRKVILNEQNGSCNKCGLTEWLGESITLELEHKDGNNKNNKRENLELLCPNCHSQTETWRGRNVARKRVSDEELITALSETENIRQALFSVGLTAKGNNYTRAKKLLDLI